MGVIVHENENDYYEGISEPKKTKYFNYAKKGLLVLRAAVDMVAAYKRRDPLTITMSITSALEAIQAISEQDQSTLEEFTNRLKLKRVCVGIEETICHTLNDLNVKRTTLRIGKDTDGDKHQFFVYHFEKFKLYFYNWDESVVGWVYALDPKLVNEELPKELQKLLGSLVSIRIKTEHNGTRTIYFTPFKSTLKTYVTDGKEEEYYDDLIRFQQKGIKRSSLLIGPPGTGKTLLATKINEMLGGQLLNLKASVLGETSSIENVTKIIELINPSVILFDDIDRIPNIDRLLTEVEQLNLLTDKSVIIGTVNDIKKLPFAMRRPGRFDEIIPVGLPDPVKRLAVCSSYMKHYGYRLSSDNVDIIVRATEGMSCADLKEIMKQAFIKDFNKIPALIEKMKEVAAIGESNGNEDE
jgi:hypothetical protein